jgi:hypothetical protein
MLPYTQKCCHVGYAFMEDISGCIDYDGFAWRMVIDSYMFLPFNNLYHLYTWKVEICPNNVGYN